MPVSDARSEDDRVVRSLRLKLLLVLGALMLLAVGSHLLFRRQSAALGSSAGVINICGRQRMLSQRAALLISRLAATEAVNERRSLRAELLEIADAMESHHRRLVAEDSASSLVPGPVKAQIAECPHDLDRSLREFVTGLRVAGGDEAIGSGLSDPPVAAALEAARSGTILAPLDHVVSAMQAHAEASVARLRRAQMSAVGLFILALLALIALVFRPLLRDLGRHLSELRESREALHEGRRQLQLNFENAPLGIARCRLEGSLLSVNPALCRVLGASAEELVGRPLEELFHPADYSRFADVLRHPEIGGRAHQTMTVRLRHRDDSWVSGVLHWSFVPDEDGTAIGLIAHFEDRTRQLEVEEQARQDRERLAQMARLHTLGEMAAGIAHEVNQPLTAISNYARAGRRLLEAGSASAGELESTLDKVSAQAHRAGEVIRGLRAFVRRRQSRSETVGLNRLVQEAVGLALADAHFLSVGIETDLATGIPEVAVDPVQIQQVILNLIRNAIEALEPGGGEPVVVRTSGNGEGFVEVAVEDRGAGISEAAKPRLFDPFFTSKESGLGMGLAISRSIVASHGGRIWWTSGRQGGTTFHFTLPAASTSSS